MSTISLHETLTEMARKATQFPKEDRADALSECILRRLNGMSLQLFSMQVAGVMELARDHDADREVAALLADWQFRSPITRSE